MATTPETSTITESPLPLTGQSSTVALVVAASLLILALGVYELRRRVDPRA